LRLVYHDVHQPVIALECERASDVPLAVERGLVAELDGKRKAGQRRQAVFDAATAQGERAAASAQWHKFRRDRCDEDTSSVGGIDDLAEPLT
jgi:hypothetical protein